MYNKKEYDKKYREENRVKIREYAKQWRKNNPEKIRAINKKNSEKYYKRNKDRLIKKAGQWQENNPEKIKGIRKRYYQNHFGEVSRKNKIYRLKNKGRDRDRIKEYSKKYYQDHKEKCLEYSKQYYRKHKSECRIKQREYIKYKIEKNPKYSLNRRLSRAIYNALKSKKNGRHWENLVGYTLDNLIEHLKITMPKGYNWKDYINGSLQIDHIIPISVWNYSSAEHIDFKRCWALENLRLLSKEENRKKSNKLISSFQPALRLRGKTDAKNIRDIQEVNERENE